MRIWIILVSIIYTGCGTESKNNSSPAVSEVASPSPQSPRHNQTSAFLVKTGQDLPSCGEQNPSQLIYVVETSQFMTCEGQDWLPIDVKGKDGTNGRDGRDGEPGADLGPEVENHWIDPMTGMVVAINAAGYNSPIECIPPWRLPASAAEARSLAFHGLVDKLNRLGLPKDFWWYPEVLPTDAYYIEGTTPSFYSKLETVIALRSNICVKD